MCLVVLYINSMWQEIISISHLHTVSQSCRCQSDLEITLWEEVCLGGEGVWFMPSRVHLIHSTCVHQTSVHVLNDLNNVMKHVRSWKNMYKCLHVCM